MTRIKVSLRNDGPSPFIVVDVGTETLVLSPGEAADLVRELPRELAVLADQLGLVLSLLGAR